MAHAAATIEVNDPPVPVLVVKGREDWRRAVDDVRRAGATVGLVPTMGSLHAGHLSLVRRARAAHDFVAVSVYVNPLQFGASEDLDAYPRDLEGDLATATGGGVDAVFAPTVGEMWPEPPLTSIAVGATAGRLEDVARPGHLDGMATIVTKLFALTGPATAYFGEKDFQQLVVVRRLVEDLSLPIDIVGCPTVRDPDGLALSSRNRRLTAEERELAPRLYWSLLAGKRAIEEDGVTDPAAVGAIMTASLAAEPRFSVEYAAAVDPADLGQPGVLAGEARLLVAADLGATRLIDNLGVTVPVGD